MEMKILKAEATLRFLSLVFASMEALIVGLDAQTKTVFFTEKRANVKKIQALWVLTIVATIAACYHLLQICRCLDTYFFAKKPSQDCKVKAWLFFLLDQGMTYIIFAATMAALQASLFALTGAPYFQWAKLCNVYTRFCYHIAAGLLCGLFATIAMATVTSLSAHQLFRPKVAH